MQIAAWWIPGMGFPSASGRSASVNPTAAGCQGVDNQTMSTGQSPVPRRLADTAVTVLLLVVHGLLVLYTIGMAASLANEQEYLESRCRYHNLDCSNPWRSNGAPIAIGVSVVLMVLDLALVIWRRRTRRRAFFVPLLCCVGQVVVIAALGFAGNP
nr:DUF6264 family protein [Mycobacterium sp. E787]